MTKRADPAAASALSDRDDRYFRWCCQALLAVAIACLVGSLWKLVGIALHGAGADPELRWMWLLFSSVALAVTERWVAAEYRRGTTPPSSHRGIG